VNETLALFDRLRQIPGVQINFTAGSFGTWLDTYTRSIEPTIAGSDAVGVNLIVGDRLLMKDTLANRTQVDALASYIADMTTPVILQAVVGGAVSEFDPGSVHTSSHPGWRSALVHANFPVFDLTQPILTTHQTNAIKKILQDVDDIIYPEGDQVTYYNEAWIGEPDWQRTSFGPNYARLLKIKKQVDPKGVFTCNNCVGSEIFGV
jgi:FAD/FMN-containing dehydrogenase